MSDNQFMKCVYLFTHSVLMMCWP